MFIFIAQTAAVVAALTSGVSTAGTAPAPAEVGARQASVRVDSATHTVTVTTGTFRVVPAAHAYGDMHAGHGGPTTETFTWPVDGWVRGIALRVITSDGRVLPRTLLHHLAIVNFGRRQLLKPTPERVIAFGQETSDMSLPRTVGIPLSQGMPMAVTLGWYNQSAESLNDVRLELVIDWMPSNAMPRPLSAYPVSMDVVGATGESSAYDLPAGRTSQSIMFEMPVPGRIIAAGGHLHDYGTTLRVDEAGGAGRKKVFELTGVIDSAGRVIEVSRITPGIRGAGIRMRGGRMYELTATNFNRTGRPLENQAMAYVAMLYAPERGTSWPAIDSSDPGWQRELVYLFGGRASAGAH